MIQVPQDAYGVPAEEGWFYTPVSQLRSENPISHLIYIEDVKCDHSPSNKPVVVSKSFLQSFGVFGGVSHTINHYAPITRDHKLTPEVRAWRLETESKVLPRDNGQVRDFSQFRPERKNPVKPAA